MMFQTVVTAADISLAVRLALMTPPSWLAPVDRLLPIARHLRKWRIRGGHTRDPAEGIVADVFSNYRTPRMPCEIIRAWKDRVIESHMQILALRRPGCRWRPAVRWHGLDHIAVALDRRVGAILWDSDFVYSSLITKMALHYAGFA